MASNMAKRISLVLKSGVEDTSFYRLNARKPDSSGRLAN
jgi:hypothetical protein